MQSWGSLLPHFLYMACNYETEAVGKFLLPSQPDEGNFTLRAAYKATMKVYQHDHTHVMEACEWWKQGEWIEDTRWEAEEWSRKCHHLKEEEVEAGTSVKCCKHCKVGNVHKSPPSVPADSANYH